MGKRKRANREGSVFESSDGTWRGFITLGYGPDGKQKKKWVRAQTQAEAVKRLNKIRHLASGDLISEPERVTVEQWFRQVIELRRLERRPKTIAAYEGYMRKIVPAFGHVPLHKLNSFQIRSFYGELAHLSPSVRQHIHDFLNSSYKHAKRLGMIDRNPLEAVERPKGGRVTEPRVWTPTEVERFLKATEGHRLHAGFYLLLTAGFRIGELLGLRWSDLEGDRLYVQRTVTLVDGKPTLGPPKTQSSKRVVYLSPVDLDKLEAHREHQQAERSVAKRWEDPDLILPTAVGTLNRYENFRRVYLRMVELAGVPYIRIHDHRHTYITLARDAGVDAEVVANRVGQDVRVTMSIYSKVTEERKRKAALPLSELLARGERRS